MKQSIIARADHAISRANISEAALKVLYRLHEAGYQSFLVGGAVRDLLLGREPKDFDVGTNAHPEEVRKLFRNSRLIGRRFRLAHVRYRGEIIEVATFRARHEPDSAKEPAGLLNDEGRILRDNVYGSIEEDVMRRDFTVNALYYDIKDYSVRDFVGGLQDLEAGVLRLIGDPEQRFREDPVRMIRAVRFAAKLGFIIEPAVEEAIFAHNHLMEDVPAARLFDEVLKLFLGRCALTTFEKLRHYGLFAPLFPQTEQALATQENEFPLMLVSRALENTDIRLNAGKHVTPAFLFAALLWEPVRLSSQALQEKGASPIEALQIAGNQVTGKQVKSISIPKRFSFPMREIWTLQAKLERQYGRVPYKTLTHPRFRAAYDFLLLRSECGEASQELADWWTTFQEASAEEQEQMTKPPQSDKKRSKRRRRKKKPASSADD
ncbi:MAG: polynucleotide adenylyltransferase PcnB [Gammaproteobacteria bacterium]